MTNGKKKCGALVVTQSESSFHTLSSALRGVFSSLFHVTSMVKARQKLAEGNIHVLILNTPAEDELGVDSAIDLALRRPLGVLLIVKAELYEQVTYKTRGSGALVLTRPVRPQMLRECAALLGQMQERVLILADENARLQRKLDEMGLVYRAKCLLIRHRQMSEEQAHHYLERYAMDEAVSKREAAAAIVRELGSREES